MFLSDRPLDDSEDCQKLFGAADVFSIVSGANYEINAIPGQPSDTWAVANPDSQTVTINMFGHFMDDFDTGEWYGVGLNARDTRAFVLLHELAHLTKSLGDDRPPNEAAGDAFNRRILIDCFGKTPTR